MCHVAAKVLTIKTKWSKAKPKIQPAKRSKNLNPYVLWKYTKSLKNTTLGFKFTFFKSLYWITLKKCAVQVFTLRCLWNWNILKCRAVQIRIFPRTCCSYVHFIHHRKIFMVELCNWGWKYPAGTIKYPLHSYMYWTYVNRTYLPHFPE